MHTPVKYQYRLASKHGVLCMGQGMRMPRARLSLLQAAAMVYCLPCCLMIPRALQRTALSSTGARLLRIGNCGL